MPGQAPGISLGGDITRQQPGRSKLAQRRALGHGGEPRSAVVVDGAVADAQVAQVRRISERCDIRNSPLPSSTSRSNCLRFDVVIRLGLAPGRFGEGDP